MQEEIRICKTYNLFVVPEIVRNNSGIEKLWSIDIIHQ